MYLLKSIIMIAIKLWLTPKVSRTILFNLSILNCLFLNLIFMFVHSLMVKFLFMVRTCFTSFFDLYFSKYSWRWHSFKHSICCDVVERFAKPTAVDNNCKRFCKSWALLVSSHNLHSSGSLTTVGWSEYLWYGLQFR